LGKYDTAAVSIDTLITQVPRHSRPDPAISQHSGGHLGAWDPGPDHPDPGPYEIAEVIQPGAYRLREIDSSTFTDAWNIEQLREFYR